MLQGIAQSAEWKQEVEQEARSGSGGRLVVYDIAILCNQLQRINIHRDR